MSSLVERRLSFSRMWRRCASTVFIDRSRRCEISRVLMPSPISLNTSSSRSVSAETGSSSAPRDLRQESFAHGGAYVTLAPGNLSQCTKEIGTSDVLHDITADTEAEQP